MLMATAVFLKLFTLSLAFVFVGFPLPASGTALQFSFSGGFRGSNLSLDGIAEITNNGLLMLTNNTVGETGHAFYPDPISLKNASNGEAFSFSTTFVFAIRSQLQSTSTDGLVFVIAPTKALPKGRSLGFLGLFNSTTTGSTRNHIVAVELDTFQNPDLGDINANHVGIDINGINSSRQQPAGYYSSGSDHGNGSFQNLSLASGKPMQLWVDYDGTKKQIDVTLAPPEAAGKPRKPLLSFTHDLSTVVEEKMYVGFSSSIGAVIANHYILGWSFGVQGGMAQQLDISHLPKLPRIGPKKVSWLLTIGLPSICFVALVAIILSTSYYVRRKMKFAEVLEDWEDDYGPHRFKYKDLHAATRGFKDTEVLGAGGFGRVYHGILPNSKIPIAVKRVSHDSQQGIKEFVAEIVSIGRMKHRNLVPLLGYCRRKGELILVYEYMRNGSLDKLLFKPGKLMLNWAQRFNIIKGVASGLFYLHQGWEQVVIHRDIKASNVLVDDELNGRLGDFGLAKLYDHGTDPQTTNVVGTVGYLAPEHHRTFRATTSTDVYAFGAFLLEVVCGRRPVEPGSPTSEERVLVDWVFWCWCEGRVLETVDRNLGDDYIKEEAELVLKLGLLCSSAEPKGRPSMQKVMLYLDGSMALPELSAIGIRPAAFGFENVSTSFSYTSSSASQYSRAAESLLSATR